MEHGRPTSYWLAGFFNPQGFLTAVRQEATRLHNQTAPANDRWTLDKVQLRTEVKRMERTDEKNEVTAPPPDGVYIHGLFLEGASWDKKNGCLQDPEPKVGLWFSLQLPLSLFGVSSPSLLLMLCCFYSSRILVTETLPCAPCLVGDCGIVKCETKYALLLHLSRVQGARKDVCAPCV